VGPRAGMNAVERKFCCPCRDSNSGRQTRSPSLYRLSYLSVQVSVRKLSSMLHKCPAHLILAEDQFCYCSTALVGLGRFFSSLMYKQSVGLLG
jgi:hypothetical protein